MALDETSTRQPVSHLNGDIQHPIESDIWEAIWSHFKANKPTNPNHFLNGRRRRPYYFLAASQRLQL